MKRPGAAALGIGCAGRDSNEGAINEEEVSFKMRGGREVVTLGTTAKRQLWAEERWRRCRNGIWCDNDGPSWCSSLQLIWVIFVMGLFLTLGEMSDGSPHTAHTFGPS